MNVSAVGSDESVITRCATCGKKNRILRTRLGEDPICGECKGKVFPRRAVVADDQTFAEEVEGSPLPVLVDFWAPWCGPCRTVGPIVESIAGERAGRLKVVKVNVDESPRTAARFGIQAIPSLFVFRGAQIVDQIRGALPRPALAARLDRLGL